MSVRRYVAAITLLTMSLVVSACTGLFTSSPPKPNNEALVQETMNQFRAAVVNQNPVQLRNTLTSQVTWFPYDEIVAEAISLSRDELADVFEEKWAELPVKEFTLNYQQTTSDNQSKVVGTARLVLQASNTTIEHEGTFIAELVPKDGKWRIRHLDFSDLVANIDADDVNVRGTVYYGETDLVISPSVVSGPGFSQYTANGLFNVKMKPGINTVSIKTRLLGDHENTVYIKEETTDLRLEVPTFPGWNSVEHNSILVWYTSSWKKTIRWELDQTLTVWIQPADTDSRVQEKHVEWTKQAFKLWEEALDGVISFTFTSDPADEEFADIAWYFVEDEVMDFRGIAGNCTIFFSPTRFIIRGGEIHINVNYIDNWRTYLHEAGHCIGLDHSPNRDHIMYSGGQGEEITPTERNLVRLLYSIPMGSDPVELDLINGVSSLSTSNYYNTSYDPIRGLYQLTVH